MWLHYLQATVYETIYTFFKRDLLLYTCTTRQTSKKYMGDTWELDLNPHIASYHNSTY